MSTDTVLSVGPQDYLIQGWVDGLSCSWFPAVCCVPLHCRTHHGPFLSCEEGSGSAAFCLTNCMLYDILTHFQKLVLVVSPPGTKWACVGLTSEIGKGHRPSSHWHMFVRTMVNNLYRTFGNFFWITCHAMNLGMHKSRSSVW